MIDNCEDIIIESVIYHKKYNGFEILSVLVLQTFIDNIQWLCIMKNILLAAYH